jgi:peptide/nickel transport system substrate-binding protein
MRSKRLLGSGPFRVRSGWLLVLLLCVFTLALVFAANARSIHAQEPGGTLIYGEYGAPIRLVPILANDSISIRLIEFIYGSLLYYDSNGEIKGDLAESWEMSKDLRSVTFQLRKDVLWHPLPGEEKGRAFTADDVIKTFDVMMNPKTVTSLQSRYSFIDSVQKAGDYTIVFRMTKPLLNVFGRFTFKIMPSFMLEDVSFLRGDEDLLIYKHPIGTGPYMFQSQHGSSAEVVLKANGNFHLGTPYIGKIVMRPFADQNIITQTLLFGGIDMEVRVPSRDIAEIQGDSRFELAPYSTLSYSFFGYNMRNPILAIKEVRKAISYSINRQEMLNSFFEGKGQLISGPFAPGSWAYNLDVEPIPFSPDEANRLLDRAGFIERTKDGFRKKGNYKLELQMVIPISKENETTKRVILAFQNYLKDVGVQVTIRWLEWKAWTETVFMKNDFDIIYADWLFDDSFDISSLFSSREIGPGRNNFGAYRNPEVDALLDEARATMDSEKKRTIYRRLHEILAEDVPYTYLWTLTNYAAYNKKLRRVDIHPTRFFTYVKDWYIAAGDQKQ